MRLSPETLAQAKVTIPGYDRRTVRPGVVHIGLGNFARAHLASYLDQVLADDPRWGLRGVSLRRPDMREALAPQSGLYTLVERDGGGASARVIGAVLDVLDRGDGLAALTAPETAMITLTVTEKGYCRTGAGDLDLAHPDIQADLAAPETPRSVPGLLVEALRERRARNLPPVTVASLDNLPGNGAALARVVAQFAEAINPALARWIEGHVAFPSSMVDRIVPATTDQDRAEAAALTGLEEAWPVVTEPFRQWVLEDQTSGDRPDLAAVGVELVADVDVYEAMKLRMLNGAHSTLAYLGLRAGHETVADAMGDLAIAETVMDVMRQSAATVDLPARHLAGYAERLRTRFLNPALNHRLAQIAMDGSQKLPQRLLAPIAEAQAAGLPWDALAKGVAAWMGYLLDGIGPVDDPLADQLKAAAAEGAERLMDRSEVFGTLGAEPWFRARVLEALAGLQT